MSNIVYDTNRDKILEECKEMFNDICLSFTHVYRLVGFMEGEDDYYYIFDDYRGNRNYVSCCICIDSLKNKVSQYEALEMMFTLNGCPPAEEFLLKSEVDELNAGFYNVVLEETSV